MTGPVHATSSDNVYSTVVRALAARGIDVDNLVEGVDADELAGEPWLRAVVDVARDRLRADIVTALRERIGDPESSKWDDDRDAQWAQGYLDAADDIEAKVIAP